MRNRLLQMFLAGAMAIGWPVATLATDEVLVREVTAASEAYLKAAMDRDQEAIAEILADDYTIILEDGTIKNKKEALELFAPDPSVTMRCTITDVVVRAVGLIAIETGRQRFSLEVIDQPDQPPPSIRYTSVWEKQQGKWRVLHEHVTSIAEASPPPQ